MKKKLILFGTGILSELNFHYFSRMSEYAVVAFTCSKDFIESTEFHGIPVVPWEGIEKIFSPVQHSLFISVGPTQLNNVRAKIFDEAKGLNYNIISYIDQNSIIWDGFNYGKNQLIATQAEIMPYATIGDNVYIYNGALVSHHSKVGDHCFISAGAIIGGGVVVGEKSFIGLGAVIRDGVEIAPSCVIGAGAVILEDTKEYSVYKASFADRLPIKPWQISELGFDVKKIK